MFKVSFQKLQELFLDEQKWLSQNCIVAVAGGLSDGTSGLQEDSSFAAFRQEVERFADVIFASSPKQRDFWLGKTPAADRKTIEEKYKALKPCMHGSDAHRVESVRARRRSDIAGLKEIWLSRRCGRRFWSRSIAFRSDKRRHLARAQAR
jgi:hypothetical protein